MDNTWAAVKLCQGPGSKVEKCAVATLKALSEDQAIQEAVCSVCGVAPPEAKLLICENFAKLCSSTTHIHCLSPPLKKVPEGDWYCSSCSSFKATAKGPSKSSVSEPAPKAKGKAKAKAAPSAKVTAKAKAKAKVLSKAKSGKSKHG